MPMRPNWKATKYYQLITMTLISIAQQCNKNAAMIHKYYLHNIRFYIVKNNWFRFAIYQIKLIL